MVPLQLSVYWRLALLFLITPLVFFLDIFTNAIFAASCRHSNVTDTNGSVPPGVDINQSRPADGDADWWMKNGAQNVSDNLKLFNFKVCIISITIHRVYGIYVHVFLTCVHNI